MARYDMHHLYDGNGYTYDSYTASTGYYKIPHRLVILFEKTVHPLHSNMKVMDFGCGTGRLTENILKKAHDISITAVEPCESMALQFRKKFGRNSNCMLVHDGYRGEGTISQNPPETKAMI